MYRFVLAAAVVAGLAPSPLLAANGAPAPEAPPQYRDTYRSAFEGFRVFEETRESAWPAANERVRETGGHAGALTADEDDPDAADRVPSHAGHHR